MQAAAVHIVERSVCAQRRDEQPVGAADGGGCAVYRAGQPGLRGDTGHTGVSEETGKVSVAVGGELIHDIDADSLRNKLEYLRRRTIDVKSFRIWRGRLKHEGKDI